jgi:uncharacterized membrane protein YedE/YeeE
MKSLIAGLSGLIFGWGLLLSGMTNPAKVQNFLDLFGTWDASLAFVMGGAVLVMFLFVRLTYRKIQHDPSFECSLPSNTHITRPLILGSALFGIGWGLTGVCPGPALIALSLDYWPAWCIVPAMLIGFWLGNLWQSKQS